jgi:hypothetical protein
MVGDTAEDIGKIVLRVDGVELGAFDQRVHGGGASATGIGAGEQPVLAANRDATQGALGSVVVEGKPAIVKAAGQCGPARPHVAEGAGELGFAGELARGRVRPDREGLGDRLRSLLAFSSSVVGGRAFDRLLDAVELADAVERLLGDRRGCGGMYIEELAPDMRPAGGLDDLSAREQLVEAGIAIGVDDAAELLQVGPRVLALKRRSAASDDRLCPLKRPCRRDRGTAESGDKLPFVQPTRSGLLSQNPCGR